MRIDKEEFFPFLRVCVQSCRRMRICVCVYAWNVNFKNYMLLNSNIYTLNVNSKIQNVFKEKNQSF
jgi:acetone carboxylase gamma subunit